MAKPKTGTLLLDLGPASCGCTDHTLDELYKAIADPPDRPDLLYAKHPDPFLRDHVEAATGRMFAVLRSIETTIFLRLSRRSQNRKLAKAMTVWARWTADRLEKVRDYLETKYTADYTPDDWALFVDWVIQSHLPENVIKGEAEYLAVRSVLAGRIRSALDENPIGPGATMKLLAAVPVTVAGAKEIFELSKHEQAVIEFARARAAEFITELGERTRHRMAKMILEHENARALGEKTAGSRVLQSRLFDEFAVLNRDWRRIAVTECTRNAAEGYLSALEPGTRVRRIEAYAGACPWCVSIRDRVFDVVAPDAKNKNGETQVWVGKTNVGRAASPRKRVGDELVERTPSELWWVAAGPQHPNCRGGWVRVSERPPGADPKFEAWLDNILAKA